MSKKYYTVYQITDLINNNIYVGAHSTNDLNDGYYGSGTIIRRIIKKRGKSNLEKNILFIFNNQEDMLAKELEIVNEEFVKRKDTYNLTIGGIFNTTGYVSVKDVEGEHFLVKTNDKRYLSKELTPSATGQVTVKDKNGFFFNVGINDKRYLSGELKHNMTNKVLVIDDNGKNKRIDKEQYKLGSLKSILSGIVIVKDKNGNIFRVSKNDERYLNGKLTHILQGYKHTEEAKQKIAKALKGKGCGINNSQYGTCWIYNTDLKQNKKIKKDNLDEWLLQGWLKGRKRF